MRKSLTIAWVLFLGLACGCGKSSDPAAGQPAADPEIEAMQQELASLEQQLQSDATGGEPAAAPSMPRPAGPVPTEVARAPASGGLAEQAFRSANERVLDIMNDIMVTLDGVTDEASAQRAAPRLAELTPQWQSAAKAGTAAYLALDDEDEDRIYQEAMLAHHQKTAELPLTHKLDLIRQMQRVAKAGGPAIERELVAFRDAFLSTRGIYSTTRARAHMAEKLGSAGSQLKTN